jgi:hypothetical protein
MVVAVVVVVVVVVARLPVRPYCPSSSQAVYRQDQDEVPRARDVGWKRGREVEGQEQESSIPYPPTYHVPHAGTRLSLRPFPSFCGRSAHERESVSAVILSAHQSSRIAAQLSSFSCRCATERETEAGKAEICRPIFLFLIRELISSPSTFAPREPTCRGWCASLATLAREGENISMQSDSSKLQVSGDNHIGLHVRH